MGSRENALHSSTAQEELTRGTYSSNLHQVGYHDNAGGLFLPHHPPEVIHRLMNRTYTQKQRHMVSALCGYYVWIRNNRSYEELFK